MITKDTGIIEAVQSHPEIMEVFAEYGLGCIGCMAAHFETIGQGAGAHGIDVDALIEDINKVIAEHAENKDVYRYQSLQKKNPRVGLSHSRIYFFLLFRCRGFS